MATKIQVGEQQLEWGTQLVELRDCNDVLEDGDALREQFETDGYLLVRDLHERDAVLAARRKIFEYLRDEGGAIPGETDVMEGVIAPEGKMPKTMGHRPITHTPEVRAVLEGKPIFEFFETFFGETPRTFDYKWLRAVGEGTFTGAHYDVVYMGRGSKRLHTCWTPFGDIPIEQGTLCVCVGSHNLPGFQKVRDTYGKMDVDRDKVQGWFEGDPTKITDKFGGQWATTNFRAGDVLIIGMFTMHMSTTNTTGKWRLSCDTRFQPAADPVDERWVGENPKAHYGWHSDPDNSLTMAEAREEWGV